MLTLVTLTGLYGAALERGRIRMLSCGRDWQPTSIGRVIELVHSSTCAAKVATDAGIGFVKGMGNPQGNESLALELVGTELAAAIGLRVPQFAIVEIAGLQIPMARGGVLDFGPAFISRELRGQTSDGSDTFPRRLTNPNDMSLLVIFDTWVRNIDRCPPEDYLDPTPKRDNLFFTLKGRKFEMVAFDHTHCFVEEELEAGLTGAHFVEDDRVYGVFPEFRPYLSERLLRRAIAALAQIDLPTIREIVGSIPHAWGPSAQVRKLWAEQIFERGQRVEEYVFARLVPQLQMRV